MLIIFFILIIVFVVLVFGWIAASKIIAIQRQTIEYDQKIIAIHGTNYTIQGGAYNIFGTVGGVSSEGIFTGILGPPSSVDDSNKTSSRTLSSAEGQSLKVGDTISLQGNIWISNPKEALDIGFQNIMYKTELGEMNAWLITGSNDTSWTVGVHGIGADKNEMLRFVKPIIAAGDTMMIINYRNDINNPESLDGHNNLGDTEWRDLEAAVDYARSRGATSVRLYGISLGGSIVMNFLRRTDQVRRDLVTKIILDSPALDWGSILRSKAKQEGYPEQLYYPTAFILWLRTGIRVNKISTKPDDFVRETLIIHSANDMTVPQSGSKRAAEGNPAFVWLEDFGEGGHVRSWNYDSVRYEKLVTSFLKSSN